MLSVLVKVSSSFTQFSTGESEEFRDLSEDWLTPKTTKAGPRHDFKGSRIQVTDSRLRGIISSLPAFLPGGVSHKKKRQDFEKSLKHRILLKSKVFCHYLLGAA